MTANENQVPAPISIDNGVLMNEGFVPSGITRFLTVLRDYGDRLFRASIRYAKVDKADDLDLEVTSDHVRSAAHIIAPRVSRPPSHWAIAGNIGEYLGAITAGIGGGHLDKPGGIAALVVGVSVAVILIVFRLTTRGRRD